MRVRLTGVVGFVVVMTTACGASPSTSVRSGSAAPSPSGDTTIGFARLTNAVPPQQTEAAIEMAFDAAGAQRLVAEAPPIDYATQALLCLSLGERPTGGWSVTIQSMRVTSGELQILAREGRPRAGEGTTQAFTYPADCAVVDRTQLPTGSLAARADDTISDEFIVDATIEVPSR